ncbi:hypothetical protein [Saccharomonospora sp.]|uniref:nitroreductase family protein n=1 Tax=Saccharomonospora sp. TaxID=33913 RepID=UPI0026395C30|nr:hypothetical protein [Saccharomonospora sp.]
MLVQLCPGVRILPPSDVTGDRWIAEDLLRKRRFTVSRSVAAAMVAAIAPDDRDALVKRLTVVKGSGAGWENTVSDLLARGLLVSEIDDNHQWLLDTEASWGAAGWREAVEYHALTFDYPCVDYSKASGRGIDRSRMLGYQAEEPDDNRYKLDYLNRPEFPLPTPTASMSIRSAAELWTEAPASPGGITASDLETVLSLTFGVTGERVPGTASSPLLRRTSPSGGGRHPSEGYVFIRSIPGMSPGWYHVTLKPFGLRFLKDTGDIGQLFPDLPADPAAVIAVTSVFERNMYRYREPRTFRTVHMDAGHLIGTGRLVAEALGLSAVASDGGHSQTIEEILGLDGITEGYISSLGIYEVPPATAPRPPLRSETSTPQNAVERLHWPVGTRIRAHGNMAEIADTILGATAHLRPDDLAYTILAGKAMAARAETTEDETYRASLLDGLRHWQRRRWHPSDQFFTAARRTPPAPGLVTEPPFTFSGPGIALPTPPPPGDQPVSTLLLARRSGRAFIRKPVPAKKLSSLLWHGFTEFRDGRQRRSAAHWNPAAWRICVCVFDVDGIQPGAYHYDPTGHRLHPVAPGDHRTRMIQILQGMRTPSSAGWTLGLVADLPRAQQAIIGESGLRSLYTWSGVIAQELIVLGGAHGLSTLVTPAQRDSDYLALHDLPKHRFTPIYTLTMGLSRGADGVYPDDPPAQEKS